MRAEGVGTYKYDLVSNLTNIVYPAGIPSMTLCYDPLNRVTNMADGNGKLCSLYQAVSNPQLVIVLEASYDFQQWGVGGREHRPVIPVLTDIALLDSNRNTDSPPSG